MSHTIIKKTNEIIGIATRNQLEKEHLEDNLKLDSFTKLYNHATFYEMLDEAIAEYKQRKFSILVFDIDNFKSVNDTFGHSVGDKVILALTETIVNSIEPDDYAFRYGGEEFVVISFADREWSYALAERIRTAFYDTQMDFIDKKLSVSVGVCEYNEHIKSGKALFEMADGALYDAKRSGKNRTCITIYKK